jgi:hypothetical protein
MIQVGLPGARTTSALPWPTASWCTSSRAGRALQVAHSAAHARHAPRPANQRPVGRVARRKTNDRTTAKSTSHHGRSGKALGEPGSSSATRRMSTKARADHDKGASGKPGASVQAQP